MPDLEAQQRAVVEALVGGGPMPDGFDTRRLELTRASLLRKRSRGVAAHWPALGAMPDFRRRFMDWAAVRAPGSSHQEGLDFGRALGRDLPAPARVERVLAGAGRFARDGGGLVARIPVFGARWYRAPWGHELFRRRHR